MTYTSNQAFNRVLEVQQSKFLLIYINTSDLVAGFEPSSQTAAIEDLMSKKVAPLAVLRLLCLQSLVGGSGEGFRIAHVHRPAQTRTHGADIYKHPRAARTRQVHRGVDGLLVLSFAPRLEQA